MWRRFTGGVLLMAAAVAGCGSAGVRSAAVPVASSATAPPATLTPRISPTPSAPVTPVFTPGAVVTAPTGTLFPSAPTSVIPFVAPATERGAYDFLQSYFAARERAAITGDLTPLLGYRAESCQCADIERRIVAWPRDNGVRIYRQHIEVTKWYFEWRGPAAAKVAMWQTALDVYGKPGATPTVSRSTGLFVIDLARDRERWTIADFRVRTPA